MSSKNISKIGSLSSSSPGINQVAKINRIIITIWFLVLLAQPVMADDVSFEIGVQGTTVQESTDTPNLRPQATEEVDWKEHTGPMELKSVPVEERDLEAPTLTDFMNGYMHLLRSPLNIGRGIDVLPDTMERALAPPDAGLSGTPTTTETYVAQRDGPVSLEVYLSTYNPATYAVRVYRPDGSEVLFSGKPFMLWTRPDDKAYSPLYFKGREIFNSMIQRTAGDFSPARGLRYTDNIRRGARVVVETYGDVEPGSFLRVDSPVF